MIESVEKMREVGNTQFLSPMGDSGMHAYRGNR